MATVASVIRSLGETPNMSATVDMTRAVVIGSAAAIGDLVTSVGNHGLVAGQAVIFRGATSGAGFTADTQYFVRAENLTATAFGLALTAGGALVDVTTDYVAARFDKVAPAFGSPAKATFGSDAPAGLAATPGVVRLT